ncbi:hypothetical protein ES288_A01G242100v1 [Gossypium darwinii]|uniref:GDSL esterase/lipase n=1 Tax=Gossypium darwinii TaxID=34276 RepID=A0A5D2HQA7_GOSDA|nr:hypothetical protein ES288_A01G242100v1 [Gossypium darwinii]
MEIPLFLHSSSLGTRLLMWGITTISTHLSNQTFHHMEEILLLTGQLEDSAMENLLQISLRAITLTQQLNYYREYQAKLVNMAGNDGASNIVSGAIHLLSAGSSDYIQNYYINPLVNRIYTPDQFSDILIRSYTTFIQNLYGLGARRIGVRTLPPTGCLPAAITLFGAGSNQCVARLNQDAIAFNNKLNSTSLSLQDRLPGLKLVVFDIYQPLLDMVTTPSDNGFFESRRACCGTGTLETSLLCNFRALGTCSNATSYVFWDGFHPSEAANQVLAGDLLAQGVPLIS